MAFDVHLAETFVPWVLGMTLITASRSELFEDLPERIQSLNITHVGIVPSLIEATMCSYEESSKGGVDAPKMRLRFIGSGGEKISDAVRIHHSDHSGVCRRNPALLSFRTAFCRLRCGPPLQRTPPLYVPLLCVSGKRIIILGFGRIGIKASCAF